MNPLDAQTSWPRGLNSPPIGDWWASWPPAIRLPRARSRAQREFPKASRRPAATWRDQRGRPQERTPWEALFTLLKASKLFRTLLQYGEPVAKFCAQCGLGHRPSVVQVAPLPFSAAKHLCAQGRKQLLKRSHLLDQPNRDAEVGNRGRNGCAIQDRSPQILTCLPGGHLPPENAMLRESFAVLSRQRL